MIFIHRHINKKELTGYVKLHITGISPERFMNLCVRHQIELWDILPSDEGFDLYMNQKDVKRCKPFFKKSGIHIKILEKKGLPFFLFRYRKRKMFFLGAAGFLIFLYVLSLFLWDISFEGNAEYSSSVLRSRLEEWNITCGMPKSLVDCETLEYRLRESFEDILWTSVKIRGTRLIIQIKEGDRNNREEKEAAHPMNLVSPYEGKIISIVTRAGTPLVKEGTLVSKGSILVSGNLPLYNDEDQIYAYDFCEADADIIEETMFLYQDTIPMQYQAEEETGRKNRSLQAEILKKRFTLKLAPKEFASSRIKEEKTILSLGENFILPVKIGVSYEVETVKKSKKHTKKTAKIAAMKHLEDFLQNIVDKEGEIVENNVGVFFKGDTCISKGRIIVRIPVLKKVPAKKVEEALDGNQ